MCEILPMDSHALSNDGQNFTVKTSFANDEISLVINIVRLLLTGNVSAYLRNKKERWYLEFRCKKLVFVKKLFGFSLVLFGLVS